MRNIQILIITAILYSCNVFSQSKIEKTFEKENYSEVIKTLKEKEASSYLNLKEFELLALSYYYNNDYDSAFPYFEKIIDKPEFNSVNNFYYSHCLKVKGKDSLGNVYLKRFYSENKIDHKKSFEDIGVIRKLGDRYSLKNEEKINSKYSDIFSSYNNDILYFSSTRPNELSPKKYKWNNQPYLDVYKYFEEKTTSINELNTDYHESDIDINIFNSDIYYTSSQPDIKLYLKKDQVITTKLFTSKNNFENIKPLPINSNVYSCKTPFVDYKNKRLYFSSNKEGGFGGFDIYYVDIENPTEMINAGAEINTINDEDNFYIDSNNNIYFSSNGYVGFGGKDIYTKIYDKEKKEYKRVMNVGLPVNSSFDDFGYRNIDDKGYFTSNRTGGVGDDDIYSFTVTKPLELDKILQKLKGAVTDAKTKKPIVNATIVLTEEKTEEKTITDRKGKYNFDILGDKKYTVKIHADTYKDTVFTLSTSLVKYDEIYKDFTLTSDVCKQIFKGKISDDVNFNPLLNAQIQIVDVNTKKVLNTIYTDTNGEYLFYVGCDSNVLIKVSYDTDKEPYYAEYNEYITTGSEYNKENEKNIALKQVSSKGLISDKNGNILIPTKPIYFGYNSAVIGEVSFEELNKVSDLLNEHTTWKLVIEAYSDIRGSDAYNLALSIKRAEATKVYLINKGIDKNRIKASGFGEAKPIIVCQDKECTEEEHAVNRRSEFIIK